MIEPTAKDIGRRVIYRSFDRIEVGTITDYNENFVFVRYGTASASAATRRQDLEWEK
jgi:hypothetical protein